MKDKDICKSAFSVRLYEYTTEKSFNKMYKLLVTDKDNNELFMATGIRFVDLNFDYTIRNYEYQIEGLKTELNVYKKIIDDFQNKIEVKMKGEQE